MIDAGRLRALQAKLMARAQQPPPRHWLPVVIAGCEVGIASPEVASFLATSTQHFRLLDDRLLLLDDGLDPAARGAQLQEAALRLRDAGLLRGWRNERLDVRSDPGAPPLAVIERAACRTLGLATTAVHLNAFAAGGGIWVARRAAHKQIDPGLLDNLVGGMVPAGEDEATALAREAMEEAGLDIAGWPLRGGGRIRFTRPVPEGFQVEDVQVFDATVPPAAQPRNLDGEVSEIACWPLPRVVEALEADAFTLEAALVTIDGLLRMEAGNG
jgi:8-oxo-dGTP pyrophosphatase MutT (NUDIX family)